MWHQNWFSNSETGGLLGQTVETFFTRTQSLWGFYHRLYTWHHALTFQLLIVLWAWWYYGPRYNTILPTRLHRLRPHVKWFLTICQKKAPISLFQNQFKCHFHQILLKASHSVNIFTQIHYIFPLVRNVTF